MNAVLSHKFQMYCLAQAKHENNSEFQKKPERNRIQRQMDLWLVEMCGSYAKKLVPINFAGIFEYASVVSETRFNPLRSKIRCDSVEIPPV